MKNEARQKLIKGSDLAPGQDDARQKLLAAQAETDEDIVLNISLRPKRLPEFIGQKDIIDNLKICLTAAKERKEPLEHVLFSGPPGLGKTSLSHIIAHEMGTKVTATSGPAIERAGDLIGILTNLEKGDILFIDEIHRMSKVVEEFLYPAMESFQIDFIIDKGPYAKTIKFNLKPFTLVGATTRVGLLSEPLRARFGMFYHLDFYSERRFVKDCQAFGKDIGNGNRYRGFRRGRPEGARYSAHSQQAFAPDQGLCAGAKNAENKYCQCLKNP